MIIWQFDDPMDPTYAVATRRGTWEPLAGKMCPECSGSGQKRIRPLIIEWEPGSNLVGDFVWPGLGGDVIVSEPAMTALDEHFSGFELAPVEMRENSERSARVRSTRIVAFPYRGVRLFDLWVNCWVHMIPELSSVELGNVCSTCGRKEYELRGVERWETTWNQERLELVKHHHPRKANQGLFVRAQDMQGADIFRVYEFPGCILCTDAVKELVEGNAFTNVRFLEMGEVIENE